MSGKPEVLTKKEAIEYWQTKVSNGGGSLGQFEIARIVKVLKTHDVTSAFQVLMGSATTLGPTDVATTYLHAAEQLRAMLEYRKAVLQESQMNIFETIQRSTVTKIGNDAGEGTLLGVDHVKVPLQYLDADDSYLFLYTTNLFLYREFKIQDLANAEKISKHAFILKDKTVLSFSPECESLIDRRSIAIEELGHAVYVSIKEGTFDQKRIDAKIIGIAKIDEYMDAVYRRKKGKTTEE